MIIDLESPENCLVWFWSGEKPGTSSQKWVLDKIWHSSTFLLPKLKLEISFCVMRLESKITVV